MKRGAFMAKRNKMSRRKKTIIFSVIFAVLLTGAIISAWQFFSILHMYREIDEVNDGLTSDYTRPGQSITVNIPRRPQVSVRFREVDFEGLWETNRRVVGWLQLPGTPIDNAVVQHEYCNDRYLHRLIDGRRNNAGTLFVDFRNEPNFGDRNTIIYGHNMRNLSMFGILYRYRQQEFADQHPHLLWVSPNGNTYVIMVFATYNIVALNSQGDPQESWDRNFADDDAFMAWIDRRIALSDITTDIEVQPTDRIVTLSTCVRGSASRRQLVYGVLVQVDSTGAVVSDYAADESTANEYETDE